MKDKPKDPCFTLETVKEKMITFLPEARAEARTKENFHTMIRWFCEKYGIQIEMPTEELTVPTKTAH